MYAYEGFIKQSVYLTWKGLKRFPFFKKIKENRKDNTSISLPQ